MLSANAMEESARGCLVSIGPGVAGQVHDRAQWPRLRTMAPGAGMCCPRSWRMCMKTIASSTSVARQTGPLALRRVYLPAQQRPLPRGAPLCSLHWLPIGRRSGNPASRVPDGRGIGEAGGRCNAVTANVQPVAVRHLFDPCFGWASAGETGLFCRCVVE